MCWSRDKIEVHGHRGCRGYLPENTITGFLKAVELGVNAIELDVVITGDRKVLVSHEAWFSSEFCLDPDGKYLSFTDESLQNIYKMPYKAIKRYNCGSKPHPRFLDQENLPASKPLLADVIDAVETLTDRKQLPSVAYNIEIKSYPEGDNLYHPPPAEFVDLVMEVLQTKGVVSRTMVQSFDIRPLQELHIRYSGMRLGLLVENQAPVDDNLDRLGFLPFAYNPHYSLLTENLTTHLKSRGLKIYTWTVNTTEVVQNCIDLQIDGIISDYPLLVKNII